jgi:hypothetical protein
MEEPTTILFERQITNFEAATQTGSKNLKAFEFEKKQPTPSWHYALVEPEEMRGWRLNKDYFHSLTAKPHPESLVVFSIKNLKKTVDVTASIEEGIKRNILF